MSFPEMPEWPSVVELPLISSPIPVNWMTQMENAGKSLLGSVEEIHFQEIEETFTLKGLSPQDISPG